MPLKIVAPYAGAWIEITLIRIERFKFKSLPMRERGLKSVPDEIFKPWTDLSLPMRERGLK